MANVRRILLHRASLRLFVDGQDRSDPRNQRGAAITTALQT